MACKVFDRILRDFRGLIQLRPNAQIYLDKKDHFSTPFCDSLVPSSCRWGSFAGFALVTHVSATS
jgi:hypothetical protein